MADSTPRGWSVDEFTKDPESGELVFTGEDGPERPRVRSLDTAVVQRTSGRAVAFMLALG